MRRELESFVTPTMKDELVKFYSEVKPDNVEKVGKRIECEL